MTTTYYLTKYALSTGIETVEAAHNHSGTTHLYEGVSGTQYVSHKGTLYRIGQDAFGSWDEAVADARKRRNKRVDALAKQLNRLNNLSF